MVNIKTDNATEKTLGSALLKPLIKLKYRMKVPEIFEPLPTPPKHSKAIVIGSGFGGAVAALRLAEKGIQTTVLEKGSHWPLSDTRQIFTNDTWPDGRGFWHAKSWVPIGFTGFKKKVDKFGGVFDIRAYKNLQVWSGACVGGGSMIFTGVMIPPQRENFDKIFEGILNYDEFTDEYYPLVRRMLKLDSMPDDVYNAAPFGHSRQWDKNVVKAGFSPVPNDSIFNWSVIRKEIRKEIRRSATISESNLGNSNGAKFDLTQNYLKYAEQTGFAKIYPGHLVHDIGKENDLYTLTVSKIDPLGTVLNTYQLTCDSLFIAAGTCGTNELMVKAKATGSLASLNEHVGQGFGTNGDVSVIRTLNRIRGCRQGTPSASRIETVSEGLPTTFENWYAPGVPIDISVQGSLGMVMDMKNRGQFIYDKNQNKVVLEWPKNGNQDAIKAARKLNNKISRSTWSFPGFPFWLPGVDGSWTAHPLGGMNLGKATDHYGRVYGHKNLYIMDGALIPGTTGAVNPALTICALAERNMQAILYNDLKNIGKNTYNRSDY